MVKGISRQVIVVHAPDPQIFEQAIFIVKSGQKEITDEMLLQEANKLMNTKYASKRKNRLSDGPVWACGGALLVGLVWLITVLL